MSSLQSDLLFNEIYPLSDDLEHLQRLVIINRQGIIENRVIIGMIFLGLSGKRDKVSELAHHIPLLREWFIGAMRSTSDPKAILQEWHRRLKDAFANSGLEIPDPDLPDEGKKEQN